jgi:hypothetical protein
MSQLSTFFPTAISATSLGLGTSANVTFGSVTTGAVTASGTVSGTGFDNYLAAPPAIGNTTPSTGAFTTLTASDGTRTATLNQISLTLQAGAGLNDVGVTALTNVSSCVCLYANNIPHLALLISGTPRVDLTRDTLFRWREATNGPFSGVRFSMDSEEANTLAFKNSTNAQTFRIYNTFTNATNHERGFLRWSSNVFQIGTEKGSGGGTARQLRLQTDGTDRVFIDTDGAVGFGILPARPFHISGSTAWGRIDRVGNVGPAWLMVRQSPLGTNVSSWVFGPATGVAGVAGDDFAIIDYGAAIIGTAGTPRLTIGKSDGQLTVNGNLNLSTKDLVTDTTTGTKIGTSTSQKIGFFNATPVDQPATVADPSGVTTDEDVEARTAINAIIDRLQELGLIA